MQPDDQKPSDLPPGAELDGTFADLAGPVTDDNAWTDAREGSS